MVDRTTASSAVLVSVLLLVGCTEPGGDQEAAPCVPLERTWNDYAPELDPVLRPPFREALEGFDESSSNSIASDAARLATSNLLSAISGDRRASEYFWNAMDLIGRECAEAGVPLSFDHHGEQLTTGSSADLGRPPWALDPPPQPESGTIEPTIPE
ncbi:MULTISPECIES: hypothetical protein [unclassified Rathayibacter]|uniref:hypothetical protein n=1 Tax=unclassified Rathayibacter TaxID=2609250 RepID=UPI000CE83E01|nr:MULTISPECIES: hypothetical protein [unclassified Rathayibacter]PPF29705.1 hypothetical protein C5C54_02475 [Rathayibacter sp. AY1F2]PPH46622.1 hypothetical protein C5C42_06745 [Rathayibacter sp. AY1F7]